MIYQIIICATRLRFFRTEIKHSQQELMILNKKKGLYDIALVNTIEVIINSYMQYDMRLPCRILKAIDITESYSPKDMILYTLHW